VSRRRWGCALALGAGLVLLCGGAGGSLAVVVGGPVAVVVAARHAEGVSAAAGAPDGGRFLPGPDGPLHVLDRGTGPVVVLVHGSGAWSGAWRDTTEALVDSGYRVVAVDLPPFGYSARPTDASYDRPAQAERLLAVVDALDVSQAVWVGHSFGGGPTLELALRHPDRVGGLALVDVALALDDTDEVDAVDRLLGIGAARQFLVACTFSNRWATQRLLAGFVADPADATADRVAIYQRPLDVEGTTAATAAWLPELWSPTRPAFSLEPDAITAFDVPTAVIWGTADTVTPIEQGRQLVDLLPQGELHPLEGLGHIPLIEDPDAFHAVLLPYVAQVTGR